MDDGWAGVIAWVLVMVFVLLIGGCCANMNRITPEIATQHFATLAGVQPDQITVTQMSNNNYPFGDPHEVSFELLVKGEHKSGRCTSGTFSPIVCFLYNPGTNP